MENKSSNNFISYVGLEEHELQVIADCIQLYVAVCKAFSFVINFHVITSSQSNLSINGTEDASESNLNR